jgi:hypothetical protein
MKLVAVSVALLAHLILRGHAAAVAAPVTNLAVAGESHTHGACVSCLKPRDAAIDDPYKPRRRHKPEFEYCLEACYATDDPYFKCPNNLVSPSTVAHPG